MGAASRPGKGDVMHRLPVLASVLAVLGLVVLPGAGAQEASPATTPAALPPPLAAWEAAMATRDPGQILALFTDDAVWEEVPLTLVARGPAEIGAHLERLFAATPDIAYDVTGGFAAGDRAAAEWVIT